MGDRQTAQFVVVLDIPSTATIPELAVYIREQISRGRTGVRPDDPLFYLDTGSVGVRYLAKTEIHFGKKAAAS